MKDFIKYFFSFFPLMREFLFPAGCAVCGVMLWDKHDAWYGLCSACRERLVIEDSARCFSCGRALISEIDVCLQCRNKDEHYIDKLVAVFPYSGIYQKLLKSYKFGKHLAVGHFFAEKMLAELKAFPAESPVLVPVPPRAGKIKHSGWDQIDYMAYLLQKEYTYRGNNSFPPVYKCLKRLKSTSQKELDQEKRKTNLLGRICIKGKGKIPREVILFDDVITTGSTLDACAVALRQGGAQKVYALCLFYN